MHCALAPSRVARTTIAAGQHPAWDLLDLRGPEWARAELRIPRSNPERTRWAIPDGHSRMNTARRALATFGTLAFAGDE